MLISKKLTRKTIRSDERTNGQRRRDICRQSQPSRRCVVDVNVDSSHRLIIHPSVSSLNVVVGVGVGQLKWLICDLTSRTTKKKVSEKFDEKCLGLEFSRSFLKTGSGFSGTGSGWSASSSSRMTTPWTWTVTLATDQSNLMFLDRLLFITFVFSKLQFTDNNFQNILLLMLGFEPRISGVGSNSSANCTTTMEIYAQMDPSTIRLY